MPRFVDSQKISQRAYELHHQNPMRPSDENWLQAEAELSDRWNRRLLNGLAQFLSPLIFLAFGVVLVVVFSILRQEIENAPCIHESICYSTHPYVYHILFYGITIIVTYAIIRLSFLLALTRRIWRVSFSSLINTSDHKTIWDWIRVLGAPSIFAMLVGVGGYILNESNQSLTKVLASRRENEELMKSYIQDMAAILSTKKWIEFNQDQRVAISTRTLNTLEALENDPLRQGIVFRFATRVFPDFICLNSKYDARERRPHAITTTENQLCNWPKNVSLSGIALNGLRIDDTNSIYRGTLKEAVMHRANLADSDFTLADLQHADLQDADLQSSRFSALTILNNTNLDGAKLDGAIFDGTDLSNTKTITVSDNGKIKSESFLEHAQFNKITLTLHPNFTKPSDMELNPMWPFPSSLRDKGSSELNKLCQLIEDERIQFNDLAYLSYYYIASSEKKGEMTYPVSPYPVDYDSPVSGSRVEVTPNYRKSFREEFFKKYGCLPFK